MHFEIIPTAEASVVTLMKSIDRVIINPLIFFLFALAMVYFLYGVAQYLIAQDNEEVRETSKSHMVWGLLGLFVMVAVFGIENLILSSLGVTNIKISTDGNYGVNGTDVNGDQKSGNLNQGALNSNVESETSGTNLSNSLVNQDKNIDPTKSIFPDYISSSACWRKIIHRTGATEYTATHFTDPTTGDDITMHDFARNVYINETGNKSSVDQNLPIIFDSEVIYSNKTALSYHLWMDLRAPTKANSEPGDCDLKLSPTQSSDNYTYLDKYKANNKNISTAVQDKAIDPTVSPFPDYDANPLCWRKEFYLSGDTEYLATHGVAYNNTKYSTLEAYLRAFFLGDTKSLATVNKDLPIMYSYEPLFNKDNKKFYVWIDLRAPIKTGTTLDCNLKVSAVQSTDNYKLVGRYSSSDTNISAAQNLKVDFTKSPFDEYIPNASCWRKEMLFKDKTEYKALQFITPQARTAFLSETHQMDSKQNENLPIKFGIQTAFNPADQLYYVWADIRSPVGASATAQSCNLVKVVKLPAPQNQSTKTSSLVGTVSSDAKYWRVVDSGASQYLADARSIAINNALIQIAKLKGVSDINTISYRVIPPEKYFPLDASTGNYDYFIAIESPK
jgi:hypothetical protein